jgi:NADH pyrophosphatase NudC (nudix superfamily)
MEDATILAQARPILEWHQFNKFCPRCASKVSMEEGGYKQSCSNTECASNKSMCNRGVTLKSYTSSKNKNNLPEISQIRKIALKSLTIS